MHGVLKVKTTAEEETERKKEREEKVKKFKALTKQIFDKRKNGELDIELMSLTEKLLGSNPDFYTMWNIRKEIFLKIKDERSEAEMNDLYNQELKFLQNCLHVNPKSYGVWEHRRFSLQNMPNPDWEKDLNLCNKFLSLDSRNFHCWDYRRFLVKNANVSSQEEFDFTTKKISENFSNYSAWHNRSKLLPLVYPDPKFKGKVEESALLKEFELVQNAFFTDPNDQSAWFYQRWLLGREEKKLEILHFDVKRTDVGLRLIVSLSKKVNPKLDPILSVSINDVKLQDLVWTSSCHRNTPAHVWIADVRTELKPLEIILKLEDGETKECSLAEGSDEVSWSWHHDKASLMFRDDHTAAKTDVLNNELESCKMLLEEETENKWVMLTVIFLMRALDPEKYSDETEVLLNKLILCDAMRKGYYEDLRSKYRIEDKLRMMKREKENFEMLDLQGRDLTAVYHLEYLTGVKVINLASNNLKSLHHTHMLQNAVLINLDSNEIGDLSSFCQLPYLKELSLTRNNIKTLAELEKLASNCSMKTLSLSGNPICKLKTCEAGDIKRLLPYIETIHVSNI